MRDKQEFNRRVLLDIHALILQGIDRANAGIYRWANVRISGSRHVCPAYEKFRIKWIFKHLEFLAPNMGQDDEDKGYYFFKRIEPYLHLAEGAAQAVRGEFASESLEDMLKDFRKSPDGKGV